MKEDNEWTFRFKKRPHLLEFAEDGKVFVYGEETTDVREISNAMLTWRKILLSLENEGDDFQ